MDSKKPLSHCDRGQNVTYPANKSVSRRTLSFSSSSSSSSFDDSPSYPASPLRFSGIPFSWEQLPGIPKKPSHKKKDTMLMKVLPLPPTLALPTSKQLNFDRIGAKKKVTSDESFQKDDPFLAALVECSKDEANSNVRDSLWSAANSNKITRSISDRFGFISLYTSCKKTCAVSESIVYLPRSSRTSYDLIPRSSRQT